MLAAVTVIPAKTGIQAREAGSAALGPCLRGGDEEAGANRQ